MQIHELTKKQLNEASIVDYIQSALSKDPAVAAMRQNPNVSFAQRAQAIGQNKQLDQVANLALKQWNQRYLNLVRANNNQPLSANDYTEELAAFAQKNLLPKYVPFNQLTNRSQLLQAFQSAAANSNNPAELAKDFNRIIDLAAVARETTALTPQSKVTAFSQAHSKMQSATQNALSSKPAANVPGPKLTIGGQTLDYNDPADAAIIKKLVAQHTADANARVNQIPGMSDEQLMKMWNEWQAAPEEMKSDPDFSSGSAYQTVQDQLQKRGLIGNNTQQSQSARQAANNVISSLTGSQLNPAEAADRVNLLLKQGNLSPREVQNWAKQLPPGSVPTGPISGGNYPVIDSLVNKLLGLSR